VRAVSLRPGETFNAATYFDGRRGWSRCAREDGIVVTLAGDLGFLVGIEPLTGYTAPVDEAAAAEAAVVALARVPRSTRGRILAAEAARDGESDADSAWHRIWLMDDGDVLLIGAHLAYLTARASAIVRKHPRQIRALAERLYRDTVVAGPQVERIVKWWLCACHNDWGAGQQGRAPAL
jgi:hypothetical protein